MQQIHLQEQKPNILFQTKDRIFLARAKGFLGEGEGLNFTDQNKTQCTKSDKKFVRKKASLKIRNKISSARTYHSITGKRAMGRKGKKKKKAMAWAQPPFSKTETRREMDQIGI